MEADALVPGTFLATLAEPERAALEGLGVVRRFPRGVLLMFDTVLATALIPSLTGRAPKPPLTDS